MHQLAKGAAIMAAAIGAAFMPTYACADSGRYAEKSILSEGKWVKINVAESGLHTISRQTLRNFGFDNPDKVNVYGYGGRLISEALTATQPDDLPKVPSVRSADGSLTFYATGTIALRGAATTAAMEFDHTINPYGETSYYFLSDREAEPSSREESDLSAVGSLKVLTAATQHLVHEKDLMQCAESGRDYLGEDFRANKAQDFKFDLPGNASGKVKIRVKFGANATAESSIMVSANGERLAATNSDRLPAVTSSSQYYTTATSTKTADFDGNSLTVGVEYTQGGVVKTARLDWIEVEYTRQLALNGSHLLFHVNPREATAYRISGAGENTRIWDVTDPWDIKEVKYAYDAAEKTATIATKAKEMREFLAFDPSAKGTPITTKAGVANQDIHGMETPHMLIITPDDYMAAAERIARLHRQADGMTVHILTPEKIFNEFSSGNADITAFRKLNKMWHDRSTANPDGTQYGYCLLLGRPTYDQKGKNPETMRAGYATTLIWQSADALTETSSFCTDDYIVMLEDETTAREFYKRKMNIAVGRYPITSREEGNTICDKLEAYVNTPIYGPWRSTVMAIADDGDSAAHLTQTENAVKIMKKLDAGAHMAYDKVYLDAFERKQTGAGLSFPDAKDRMLRKWEKEGVGLITYVGHANPKEWTHEKLLTWNDINGMANQKLPVLFAATCSFGKWDAEAVSGAEIMLLNPAGGAIALITPSRTVYISENQYITNGWADNILRRDSTGQAIRVGESLRLGKNASKSGASTNMYRYHLFGDPALKMPLARYKIEVDSIAGLPRAAHVADAPSVKARSKFSVSGRITDLDGNDVDFSGPLQFTLYDAEKSITTHGWGEKGEEKTYQDQSSKLATGRALAAGGKWSVTIQMPAETSNNYSPAFLTFYAFDEAMKAEASGSTDRLFVYGYDTEAADDTEGPKISGFGVTGKMAGATAMTDSNPLVLASLSDISGINVSEAGIGHQMTLILDSAKEYDDVSAFFTPDTDEEGSGQIAYPLTDLDPGDHTLSLTVWDNANNSTTAEIAFTVGINLEPGIMDLTTRYLKDSDVLLIQASTDRAMTRLGYAIECFDLNGKTVWTTERDTYTGPQGVIQHTWDLRDANGARIDRGIYIIRVTAKTTEGISTSERKKIAIPAK